MKPQKTKPKTIDNADGSKTSVTIHDSLTPTQAEENRCQAQLLIGGIQGLRDIRQKQIYKLEGYHTFREWCVAKFGEKLGCWLEEMLSDK